MAGRATATSGISAPHAAWPCCAGRTFRPHSPWFCNAAWAASAFVRSFRRIRRGFSGGKKICPTYFEIQGTYFELCPTYFPPSPMRAQSAEKEFSHSRTRKGRPGGEKPRHLHGAYSTFCRSKMPLPQAVCKSPFRTLPFALIYINLRTAGNNSTANLYGIKAYAPPEWI